MNCAEIIENYLKENNFDGLYNNEGECACENGTIDPCGEIDISSCKAGYFQAKVNEEFEFMIGQNHPKPCRKCAKPRNVKSNGCFKKCPHCGDEVLF